MSKQDKKTVTNVENPQRRELLTRATKLAVYTAPTITTLTFFSSAHAQVGGSPPDPPPPGGQTTAEDKKKKPPNRR